MNALLLRMIMKLGPAVNTWVQVSREVDGVSDYHLSRDSRTPH